MKRFLFEVTYLNGTVQEIELFAATLRQAWLRLSFSQAQKVILLEGDL
jgi:hypothetical protein